MSGCARSLSGAGGSRLPPSRCLRGEVAGNARPVPRPACSSNPGISPSALRALPVRLQPPRALLTAGAERDWKLKLPLSRERNFIFMYKVCDLLEASTATCAFIYWNRVPHLAPFKVHDKSFISSEGTRSVPPTVLYCSFMRSDKICHGPFQETWEGRQS